MAQKSKKTRQKPAGERAGGQKGSQKRIHFRVPREVVLMLVAGLWMILIFSLHTGRGGYLGNGLRSLLFGLFGIMAYLYAYAGLVLTVMLLFKAHRKPGMPVKMSASLVIITAIMLVQGLISQDFIQTIREEPYLRTMVIAFDNGITHSGPGLISALLLYWLVHVIGRMGTGILLLTLTAAAIWLSMPQMVLKTLKWLKRIGQSLQRRSAGNLRANQPEPGPSRRETVTEPLRGYGEEQQAYAPVPLLEYEPVREESRNLSTDTHRQPDQPVTPAAEEAGGETAVDVEETLKAQAEKSESRSFKPYRLPPLSLLQPKPTGYHRSDRRKMLNKAKLLEETLASFGVEAKVIKVTQGPTITRYELQPSRGVKVSKVVNLNDDIALNLAASSIRIEAPIPGKAAIGIEIPNEEVSMVPLRELLDTQEYRQFKNPLPFVLGKNIAAEPVVSDINKMPHLLVAGATGSGKSVCINSLILSLLFKSRPDEVKLLMVDPKVVELNQYNGIPHLMIPVVTDPRKATGALRWAVTEMEERYHRFAENGVRDIGGYNEKLPEDKLPYIVVIIDELADLMLVAAKEVEDYICRLAQMARAAGIHLILATQRPSVDVITGIIKANIPSRVAFSVASQVDSRTILDMGGAEKLLGKGDMLFHPVGVSKPIRIQGAFVSEEEVKSVVDFLKAQSGEPEYEEDIIEKLEALPSEREEHESDDVFQEALRIAYDHQQISISMLQRRLKMGYNRAARLIDEMEARGYVGPNEGTKPRKVINRPQAAVESGESPGVTKDH